MQLLYKYIYFSYVCITLYKLFLKKVIAKNLKTLRKSINYTQKELSKALEVPSGRYQAWEEDRAEPNICMIVKLAKYFEVSTDDLLNKELISVTTGVKRNWRDLK